MQRPRINFTVPNFSPFVLESPTRSQCEKNQQKGGTTTVVTIAVLTVLLQWLIITTAGMMDES